MNNQDKPMVSRKSLAIVTIIFVIILAGMLLLIKSNNDQKQQVQQDLNRLESKNKELGNNNDKIKNNQVSKYSASNLINLSEDSKNNINGFFKAVYNWNGHNYSDRYNNSLKYATDSTVHTMLGDKNNFSKEKDSDFVTNAIKNNMGQNVEDSHIFMEKSDGNSINGIYSVKTKTSSNGRYTHAMQWFRFEYDVQQGKVTKVAPVQLDSSNKTDTSDAN